MLDNAILWKIIHSHFNENPQSLVTHHIESYNDFFQSGIFQIFREKNPITITAKYDESIQDARRKCHLYFGGKNGDRIHIGKPVIYEKDADGKDVSRYMFPNEARLNNMTYGMTIHYDIEIEFEFLLLPGEEPYTVSNEMLSEMLGQKGGDVLDHVEMHGSQLLDQLLRETRDLHPTNFKEVVSAAAVPVPGSQQGGAVVDAAADAMLPAEKLRLEENHRMAEQLYDAQRNEWMSGGGPAKRKRKTDAPEQMTTAVASILREANEQTMVAPDVQRHTMTLENIYLGKFPIMVQSNFCILSGMTRELRYAMGECKNDVGGYFIIDGKEKTVIMQEKFADNMLYIKKMGESEDPMADEPTGNTYLYSAEIRSVSENVSKPVRTLSVKMVAPTPKYSFQNMVVAIPNVRKPVPLFIVFRALGVLSDKEIIEMCLLDVDKYESLVDLFVPSVYDAGSIFTQRDALLYIASFTKYRTSIDHALELLTDYFLPHVGEMNFLDKAYYLGYIVFRLLSVCAGLDAPTDRDNYKYKRIELVGSLVSDLFREYYNMQQKIVHKMFESRLYFNKDKYEDNMPALIYQNYREIFRENMIVHDGFKKAFKGNWGAQTHTKRIGVVQDLNRLSFNSAISHLRKTNLPLDASVKIVGPRVLHNSHWGFIDPIDTPDGANIGLHKTLAISTYVSRGYSREPILTWLRQHASMKGLVESGPLLLSTRTKVMVNGLWAGVVDAPMEVVRKIRLYRRNGLIPLHTSATFHYRQNVVYVYTDSGRVCRPIFYRDDAVDAGMAATAPMSFDVSKSIRERLATGDFTWRELISGFNKKRDSANYFPNTTRLYSLGELYEGVDTETNPAVLKRFLTDKAVVEYIDPSETEDTLIALRTIDAEDLPKRPYTHMEIHESLLLGVMCNQIIFPENNPVARNSFSCGQSRQACSLYHTNYAVRMDKTAVVLNYGQIPLLKSRYMEYINHEENPYGENAIVAIMCYTGYNVEDAVLINEAALKRGLFRTTYYTTYEMHEESSKSGDVVIDKRFMNLEREPNVVGKQPGYDYSQLDAFGLIRENTAVTDETVLIGMTSNYPSNPGVRVDLSKTPKKGQLGYVDKAFITEGEEGQRIAKIRIREERIPNLGDKMASRAGQKGTVGLIIPERDMPFTSNGIRPDMIINPHALPSRMTIGHLVECLIGKAAAEYGGFSDCTAFNNRGSKVGVFGEMLTKHGYHSSGNEILYNGMTGEQIESEIFFGPTYYMRLKHMVKDKVNYRNTGPNTALTRQPVSGRANDGGLRIGEMERDVVISHGMANFMRESMMERADSYHMAVCNTTGVLAIYNPAKNLFMSPMADGPIEFLASPDGAGVAMEHVTQFGRDFSVVAVPYSLKLLMQELQAINVQMRIITEDNVAQLGALSYSKNLQRLTLDPSMTPEKLVAEIKKRMEPNLQPKQTPFQTEPVETPTPEYPSDVSPAYQPSPEEGSPASENSPVYNPEEGAAGAVSTMAKTIGNFFTPSTPEGPPPNAPPPQEGGYTYPRGYQEGGGVGLHDLYQVNEPVFYNQSAAFGLDPRHPWYISKIGNKYITIRTESLQHGMTLSDSVQVVHPNDIYKVSEVPCESLDVAAAAGPMDAYPPGWGAEMGMPPMVVPQENPANEGIQFAPVIKIFNGNGNDNSTAPTAPDANQTDDHGSPYMANRGSGSHETTVIRNDHVGSTSSAASSSVSGTTSGAKPNDQTGGGEPKSMLSKAAVNFSNFVIKKLG